MFEFSIEAASLRQACVQSLSLIYVQRALSRWASGRLTPRGQVGFAESYLSGWICAHECMRGMGATKGDGTEKRV